MSLFVDPAADESFRPAINATSRRLAMPSLADRQAQVAASRTARVEQLADALEAERLNDETFKPRINRTSVASRVYDEPAASPAREEDEPSPSRAPVINPRSRELADESARESLSRVTELRRRLRRAWSLHAEATTMSTGQVKPLLIELGINPDDLTVAKFRVALLGDAANPQAVNGATGYIEYERYMKVFEAVLLSASATAPPARRSRGEDRSTKRRAHSDRADAAKASSGAGTAATSHRQLIPTHTVGAAAASPTSAVPRGAPTLRDANVAAPGVGAKPQPRRSATGAGEDSAAQPQAQRRAPSASSRANPSRTTPKQADAVPTPQATAAPKAVAAYKKKQAAPYVPREVREAQECTFQPKILPASAGAAAAARRRQQQQQGQQQPQVELAPNAKGFEETVDRLARAREARVPSFNDMLRTGAPPSTSTSGPAQPFVPTKTKPFNLRVAGRPHDRTVPFLFVVVEMPTGRTDRIAVCHGDTPDALALSFADKHGLDADTVERLIALLRSRIQSHRAAAAESSHVEAARDPPPSRAAQRGSSRQPTADPASHVPRATTSTPLVVPTTAMTGKERARQQLREAYGDQQQRDVQRSGALRHDGAPAPATTSRDPYATSPAHSVRHPRHPAPERRPSREPIVEEQYDDDDDDDLDGIIVLEEDAEERAEADYEDHLDTREAVPSGVHHSDHLDGTFDADDDDAEGYEEEEAALMTQRRPPPAPQPTAPTGTTRSIWV